jgi:hypothetical protein
MSWAYWAPKSSTRTVSCRGPGSSWTQDNEVRGGLLARLGQEYRGRERGEAAPGAQTSHRTPNAWCVVLFVSLVRRSTVTEPEDSITAEPEGEATARHAPSGGGPRRRPGGALVRAARTCAAEGCETRLSRYNPDSYCSVHRGWDRQVVTRRRRGEATRPDPYPSRRPGSAAAACPRSAATGRPSPRPSGTP